MRSNFINPWAEAILEQMWIVRQTTDVTARSMDPEFLLDPQAMTDYCLHPSTERLNPLEFHGKRRLSAQGAKRQALPRRTDALSPSEHAAAAGNERRTT